MDISLDAGALNRRTSTRLAVNVLEAAIEQALGFPVVIQGLTLWASPTLFEEGRVPARYVRLTPSQEVIEAGLQQLIEAPVPVEDIRTAKQMIADRRARMRREKEAK